MRLKGSYIFELNHLNKYTPQGKHILKDISISFFYISKIGVIGANGSGKSTLLKIMAGIDKDYQGEAKPAKDITVGYLAQEPELNPEATVRESVEEGLASIKILLQKFEALAVKACTPLSDQEMTELMEEQASLQEQIDAVDGWDIDRHLESAMQALGCPPADTRIATLSGGEKRRVALCRLLLSKPDLLLLDEPTNHLDADSVAWLEGFLQSYQGTLLLITHDRYFLDHVAEWILELDQGVAHPFKGHYSDWLYHKHERLIQEAKEKNRAMERELKWLKYARKSAHLAHNMDRIQSYEARFQQDLVGDKAQIVIPNGPPLGKQVLEVKNISKSYGDRTLIQNLSFSVAPGAIIGIVGLNGVGKTTLFRMLTGQETPDSGEIKWGDTVSLGYVDQHRDALPNQQTVWQAISDGQEMISLGKQMIHSRAYCAGFQFRGTDQEKIVGSLSGGERNRVHLARLLKTGANVLLLDEPTNDLDVTTIRALEDALLDFSGCLLVISHDRWFLDRLATHLLVFEAPGVIHFHQGNYAHYQHTKEQDQKSPKNQNRKNNNSFSLFR